MGPRDAVGQLKPVECNYPGCKKRFDTEKEMKNHKVTDPTHFYCKKCNVDCDDDEEMKIHKIKAMAPWLEGDMKHSDNVAPKHIVCEFCGMDFKSFGGRRIHREQRHPADQHIECPHEDCPETFTRASQLLIHLEHGKCKEISSRRFLDAVLHKHVNKEMDGHFHDIHNNLLEYKDTRDAKLLIKQKGEEVEEGGVSLLDDEDAHQKRGMLPLQADVSLLDNQEYPRLSQSAHNSRAGPDQNQEKLAESFRNVSISSSSGTRSGGVFIDGSPTPDSASQVTSLRRGRRVYADSLLSANKNDTASEVTIKGASSINAWTTDSASQVLFPDARSTPSAYDDWDEVLRRREEEALISNTESILKVRFWDPNSADFDENRFLRWNETLEEYEYRCPFAGCEDVTYKNVIDLIGHMHYAHLKVNYTCPLCLKRFKSGHALIAHSEATGKCKVKKSTKYDKLLDEVSGGFLRAEHLSKPKIAKKKNGEERKGLMDTRFVAQMPGEKEEDSSPSDDEGHRALMFR